MNCTGIFLMPVLLFWPFIFQFNIHHTTSNKNTVPDQEIHWLPILETTCYPDFLLPSLEEKLYGSNFVEYCKNFVAVWAEDFDTPLAHKFSGACFYIHASITSFSVNMTFLYNLFVQH